MLGEVTLQAPPKLNNFLTIQENTSTANSSSGSENSQLPQISPIPVKYNIPFEKNPLSLPMNTPKGVANGKDFFLEEIFNAFDDHIKDTTPQPQSPLLASYDKDLNLFDDDEQKILNEFFDTLIGSPVGPPNDFTILLPTPIQLPVSKSQEFNSNLLKNQPLFPNQFPFPDFRSITPVPRSPFQVPPGFFQPNPPISLSPHLDDFFRISAIANNPRPPANQIAIDPEKNNQPVHDCRKPQRRQMKPLLTAEEKRANHIASEQKRRDLLRTGFETLTQMVPGVKVGASKNVILSKSLDHIRSLEERNRNLREKIERLKLRKRQKVAEIK
ncbi:hypothetical protein HK098_004388 [Nowakowskiella sp. JEL0407]|nr:hypothetical protein HK098_004388 [Nowakowskiella sp. JEL0407]